MLITFIKPTLGRLADGAPFVDAARMEPLLFSLVLMAAGSLLQL